MSALGALIVSLFTVLNQYTEISVPVLNALPLSFMGFGWVLPAAIGGILGALIPHKKFFENTVVRRIEICFLQTEITKYHLQLADEVSLIQPDRIKKPPGNGAFKVERSIPGDLL